MDNQPTIINPTPPAESPETSAPSPTPADPAVAPIPPTPPSLPAPPPQAKSSKKKTFLFVLLALILIAAAAFGGYKFEHQRALKVENNQQSQINSLLKQIDSLQKQAGTSNGATGEAYTGWKAYTLKYEKLSFKYPSTWTLQDNSAGQGLTPNADNVTLTSSDGFQLSIDDGWDGSGDPMQLATDNPVAVKFTGSSAYVVFKHPGAGSQLSGQSSTSVTGAVLMTNPVSPYTASDFPQDKHAHGDPKVNNGGSTMLITGNYTGPNAKTFTTVDQAKNDPEFKNMLLVIESMHY